MSSKPELDPSQPRDDTRREFIRGSSLLLASAFPRVSSDRPIRLGVLGCDESGIRMASLCLAAAQDANLALQLVALADRKQGNLTQAKRTLKGRYTDRFEVGPEAILAGDSCEREFLGQDLDIAILSAPDSTLPKSVLACLESGVHCYTEAPLLSRPFPNSNRSRSVVSERANVLLGIGTRRQLDHRFSIPEGLASVGGPLRFRFQETLVSCHSQDEAALQRMRADHLALAARICSENDSQFDRRAIELREVITEGGAQIAFFQLGDGIELLSRVTMGQREFRSYEVEGLHGKCDFERKRGWSDFSKEMVRLPEPTSAKAARQQHLHEFLQRVVVCKSSSRFAAKAKDESEIALLHADLVAQACSDVSLPLV